MVAAIAFAPTVLEDIVVLTIPVGVISAVNVLVESLSGGIRRNLHEKKAQGALFQKKSNEKIQQQIGKICLKNQNTFGNPN